MVSAKIYLFNSFRDGKIRMFPGAMGEIYSLPSRWEF